jgi:hypothetical protein
MPGRWRFQARDCVHGGAVRYSESKFPTMIRRPQRIHVIGGFLCTFNALAARQQMLFKRRKCRLRPQPCPLWFSWSRRLGDVLIALFIKATSEIVVFQIALDLIAGCGLKKLVIDC